MTTIVYPTRVLLVEDNPTDTLLLEEAFADIHGVEFSMTHVERLADGLVQLSQTNFDVVLLDLGLPDSQGVDTFINLHKQFPDVPVLVLTGLENENIGTKAMQLGAQDYLIKKQTQGAILGRTIRYAIERHRINAELERRVADRTVQLQLANSELESFSYSVAHDLRAPLRAIKSFGDLLTMEYAEKLDATAQHYLSRVTTAAAKMDILIDDILRLARIARSDLSLQRVHLSNIVKAIANDLKHTEPERNVEFVIADDVQVTGDVGLLQIMMDNLIRNAWKYTSKTSVAKIEFGERIESENRRACFLKDNGAGFDMAYVDRLFQPFQRLHLEDEFHGNGIGLAIVQRIALRHRGRVWAEAAVDKGATFFFSI